MSRLNAIGNCIISLQRKQVGPLPEGDHQSGPSAHPTERLTCVMAQLPKRTSRKGGVYAVCSAHPWALEAAAQQLIQCPMRKTGGVTPTVERCGTVNGVGLNGGVNGG
jgi:hypothetical protein